MQNSLLSYWSKKSCDVNYSAKICAEQMCLYSVEQHFTDVVQKRSLQPINYKKMEKHNFFKCVLHMVEIKV